MSERQPIETAPKDGRPIWARGNNWGDPERGKHCDWAYWDGSNWIAAGADRSTLSYLTEWLSERPGCAIEWNEELPK